MTEAKTVSAILLRANERETKDQSKTIEDLIDTIQHYKSRLEWCEGFIDESIREVEEVAAALCGWTEGEDHPRDMRIALACASLLSSHEAPPAPAPALDEGEAYTPQKQGKILVVQNGKIAAIECYNKELVLPMGVAITGETAAQAACKSADILAGLNVEIMIDFAPFFSTEEGAATSVFLGKICGPCRPHPVHAMGYLRWVDLQEARARLSGVDARALTTFFPGDTAA